ncbi:MAG: serine/threonine protein kinase, partial [Anaerolineae bacterium]|nr:serine/threonine protein kinase [Anaerolineae bacterium]
MVTSDPLIGKRLGDYLIEGVLGTGGMARVYRGYDDALDRYAAIKVIEPQLIASAEEDEYRERFLREARAIARLNHPNIVGVYQFNQVGNLYYIAMEYVQGRNLRDILKSYLRQGKVIPTEEFQLVMRDIADALDYAHKNSIIHRDVKPSNIIVKEDGHAVLTDFGLALNAVEGTIGNTFGSVHYIAPEQAISSAQAVPQSDQYSLAIVAYELLTGRVPFDDASAMSVALKHISDPPPPPTDLNPNIPDGVEKAMLKALDKDLNKRYPSTRAFVDAMDDVFADMTSKDISLPENISPSAAVAPTTLLPPEMQGVMADEDARTVPGTESRPRSIPASMAVPPQQNDRRWLWAGIIVLALIVVILAGLLVLPSLQAGATPTTIAEATTPPPTEDASAGQTSTAVALAAAAVTEEPTNTPTEEITEE